MHEKNILKLFTFISALIIGFAGCTKPHAKTSSSWQHLPPEAGIKMFAYVSELVKISPRDSGTINASKASRWIAQEIRRMGFTPQADTWTETTAFGSKTFCNIFVDIPGETANIVLFGSHYDTKAGVSDDFQGANDGGSSTGVLLGLIEHIAETRPKLRNTIRFAFFDGEECFGNMYRDDDGLHGSKRMAAQFVQNRTATPLIAVIILDMIGDFNQTISIPRNVTPWLARIAIQEAKALSNGPRVILADNAIIDDHLPFIVSRFPAVDLIDFEFGSAPGKNDYWHTPEDTIDKISADSLYKAGALALAMLARIENGDGIPEELRALYLPPPEKTP